MEVLMGFGILAGIILAAFLMSRNSDKKVTQDPVTEASKDYFRYQTTLVDSQGIRFMVFADIFSLELIRLTRWKFKFPHNKKSTLSFNEIVHQVVNAQKNAITDQAFFRISRRGDLVGNNIRDRIEALVMASDYAEVWSKLHTLDIKVRLSVYCLSTPETAA